MDACILDALRTIVLPGFVELGVDDAAAQRWLAQIDPARVPAQLRADDGGIVEMIRL